LRKQKGFDFKLSTAWGYDVKFAVASEAEASADSSPVHLFRHKQRFTFVHKNLFKFELTRVKQGSTREAAIRADTSYEVEIEFCGQEDAAAAQRGPAYLADSLLMKAAGVLHQLAAGGSTNGASRRPRAPGGALQECDEVELADGTEVLLEPPGQGAAPRFNGEMPAQLCAWLYSHAEPDGRVCLMSEPATIGQDSFPLFCAHAWRATERKPADGCRALTEALLTGGWFDRARSMCARAADFVGTVPASAVSHRLA
jgi:hypothetical protein